MLKMTDMLKELENLKRRYAIIATELMDRAEKARSKSADDAVFSTHDAFNCTASASELATLAGTIKQTENVIRWMQEAK